MNKRELRKLCKLRGRLAVKLDGELQQVKGARDAAEQRDSATAAHIKAVTEESRGLQAEITRLRGALEEVRSWLHSQGADMTRVGSVAKSVIDAALAEPQTRKLVIDGEKLRLGEDQVGWYDTPIWMKLRKPVEIYDFFYWNLRQPANVRYPATITVKGTIIPVTADMFDDSYDCGGAK